ncbi:unnamed protein product [Nesidiocoris tenuis]|uniref:L27 domain-containing protein n=1 Tax=Nesidiocoris tenuis TaxID=355587 RepID=A0A6H5GNX8_9HEMI|nr:unnamed protein product [Nesidiocoris tenuis]
MDFDNVCTMIQGYLRSLQKSVGVQFCDVNRDHEDEIDTIAKTLETLAKETPLDADNSRSVHMLLLLNTKWEHSAFFVEDRNFCHLLNTVPTLSPYLYFKLTSKLGWHEFLGEAVLHMPEFFVREIVTVLEPELKYIEPKTAAPLVYSLLSNLFHKIMYLQERCQNRLIEFVKMFTAIAKFNFEEFIAEMGGTKMERHQYWGYVYRMLLDLIEFCIQKFVDCKIAENEFYASLCEYDYSGWPQLKTVSCRGRHCLGIVANNCIAVSDNVSIDTYLSWTEIDIMDDGVEKTLQTCVRESAYKARHAISTIPDLHNTITGIKVLEDRLRKIELKPTTEDDEIAKADADTILVNLFNPKMNQKKWLRGLINIGVFESAPHMKVVSENARLLDVESMNLLLNSAVKYVSHNSIEEDDHALVRNTLKTCLRSLGPSDQLEVLSTFTKAYSLTTPLLSPTFAQRVTHLFNKIVNDEENKDEIEIACEMEIISAEKFLYGHIVPRLEPAVSESKIKDIDFYLSIVLVLEPICKPVKSLYVAILIRILNRFRHKINSFSMEHVSVTEKSIELIESAMKTIDCGKGSGMSWLRNMAEKASPLTTLYLQPVLQADNGNAKNDALFWTQKGLGRGKDILELSEQARTELVTSTVKILPSLVMKEWEMIGGPPSNAEPEIVLYVFNVLADCILILGQIPAMLKNLLCFDHVITNFCHYTKLGAAILEGQSVTVIFVKHLQQSGAVAVEIQLFVTEQAESYTASFCSEFMTGCRMILRSDSSLELISTMWIFTVKVIFWLIKLLLPDCLIPGSNGICLESGRCRFESCRRGDFRHYPLNCIRGLAPDQRKEFHSCCKLKLLPITQLRIILSALSGLLASLEQSRRQLPSSEEEFGFLSGLLQSKELHALVKVHNKIVENGRDDKLNPVLSSSMQVALEVLELILPRIEISPTCKELFSLLQIPHLQVRQSMFCTKRSNVRSRCCRPKRLFPPPSGNPLGRRRGRGYDQNRPARQKQRTLAMKELYSMTLTIKRSDDQKRRRNGKNRHRSCHARRRCRPFGPHSHRRRGHRSEQYQRGRENAQRCSHHTCQEAGISKACLQKCASGKGVADVGLSLSPCSPSTHCAPPPKIKKILYDAAEADDFAREEIATYEEVAKLYPRPGLYRPLALVGPPGVGRSELKRRLMATSPSKYRSPVPCAKCYPFLKRLVQAHGRRQVRILGVHQVRPLVWRQLRPHVRRQVRPHFDHQTAQLYDTLLPKIVLFPSLVGIGDECLSYNDLEELDELKEAIRNATGLGARTLQDYHMRTVEIDTMGSAESAAEGAAMSVWLFQDMRTKQVHIPK